MPLPPIDPSMALGGSEWSVGSLGGLGDGVPQGVTGTSGGDGGFGGMLSNAVSQLQHTQTQAADASQSLVDGTATDPSSVVMAVERARLSMQLASQIRNKAVEAYQDIFHTQV